MNSQEQKKDGEEIFIIDKQLVNLFFKDENYEFAELFFVYLSTQCDGRKAYMIPSLFDEIIEKIKEESKGNSDEITTKVISYFENWVERAEILGEDSGEERHDTILLYKLLGYINPKKEIIILSDNYRENDCEEYPLKCLSCDGLQSYLLSKPSFVDHLTKHYGYEDGSSY